MEQILVLLLFLALPAIMRNLAKRQQKQRDAAEKSSPRREPAPDGEADAEAREELPAWLRELAQNLGQGPSEVRESEAAYEAPLAVEVPESQAGAHWERASVPETPAPPPPVKSPAAPVALSAPPRRQRRARSGSRVFVPLNLQDWRRAVVLAEVMGKPRGLLPWRGPGGSG